MISEAVDFHFLLLENYKKLKISENQLAIILMMDHLISYGDTFVTADILSLKMSLDIKEIDTILATLITKGFSTRTYLKNRAHGLKRCESFYLENHIPIYLE